MQIKSADFIKSAAAPSQFLQRRIPHVVFAGKSNVGKSSILNKLLNRKSLAKTSSTPGKTRLINYFLINDRFFFVDIPGYGYARVSKTERESWQTLIESYFHDNAMISLVFLLIDIRHDPGEHDRQMLGFLRESMIPYRILLTKADKLSKNQVASQRARISQVLELPADQLFPTSAVTAAGVKDVWSHINLACEETSKLLNTKDVT